MPARKVPEWELEKRRYLRSKYGSMMSAKQVGDELSTKDHHTVAKWLKDVPYVMVLTRKKWPVEDVARHMYEERVER